MSNSERQALHRKRLKEAATAPTIRAELYNGPNWFDVGPLGTISFRTLPRIGELIAFRVGNGSLDEYRVTDIRYVVEDIDAAADVVILVEG